jgi:preprotein translocase subunit SecD
MNFKGLLKNWRIWFLIFWIIVAAISINYQIDSIGAAINSVESNSSAAIAGMVNPGSSIQPTSKEIIIAINNQQINNPIEYYNITNSLPDNSVVKIKTTKGEYSLLKEENKSIGVTVGDVPSSNLRKGLDLQGGTRVVLKPNSSVSDSEIKDIMDTISNRLNVYGLADVTVRTASDLGGAKYIVVEIAGATKEDVKDLISKQGKFEAKIGNSTAFNGGQQDITFVCRTDGTCSRIAQCNPGSEGYICRFEFEITLSEEAASRQTELTKDLGINVSQGGQNILDKQLDFYLDGKAVDHLNIAADLKGQKATRILITGPGIGKTKQEAINSAIANKDKLQTLLITGSLSTNLEIVKLDTISPSLGQQFINNTFLVALVAILGVTLVVFLRYRVWKVTIAIIITMLSEVFIVLGLAALFKYNLDLAAIAGIIASVGTGVDDQIVITDEIIGKESLQGGTLERIKRAFFIIMVAYAATVAAMLPLLWAGVGLLKGFALVTIAGVTVGVFITRPAFSIILKYLTEK